MLGGRQSQRLALQEYRPQVTTVRQCLATNIQSQSAWRCMVHCLLQVFVDVSAVNAKNVQLDLSVVQRGVHDTVLSTVWKQNVHQTGVHDTVLSTVWKQNVHRMQYNELWTNTRNCSAVFYTKLHGIRLYSGEGEIGLLKLGRKGNKMKKWRTPRLYYAEKPSICGDKCESAIICLRRLVVCQLPCSNAQRHIFVFYFDQ